MMENNTHPSKRWEKEDIEEQKNFSEANLIERAISQNEIKNLEVPEYYSSTDRNLELMDQASDLIVQNEKWLDYDVWKEKNDTGKRVALDRASSHLQQVYKHPRPPLLIEEKSKDGELGHYAPEKWKIGMFAGEKTAFGGKLFGEDPREAFRTYCHEYRHSYQEAQILAYKRGFATDEPKEIVEIWAENWDNYIDAPDKKLAETDYEKYKEGYENYKNQPIEKDAIEFANLMNKRVYYRFSNPEEYTRYCEEKEKFAKFNHYKKDYS